MVSPAITFLISSPDKVDIREAPWREFRDPSNTANERRTGQHPDREDLETLAKALLEYETLSGDEIKKVIAGETIDRGGVSGPAIPAAGSSIPKAKRAKPGAIGGPAAAAGA